MKLSFCVSYDHTVMYSFKFFNVSGWHMICSHSNYSVLTVYNSMLYIYREIITESTLFIEITKIIPPSYIFVFLILYKNVQKPSNVSQFHSSPSCEQGMLIKIGNVLPCCLKELKLIYTIARRSCDFQLLRFCGNLASDTNFLDTKMRRKRSRLYVRLFDF